jgi:hypothetical protein
MDRYVIYGLVDPRNEEIRYVGLSSRGVGIRYSQHMSPSSLAEGGCKNNWIKSLLNQGLKPKLVVLLVCSSTAELKEEEKRIIAYQRSIGANLTNRTDGGDGNFGCVPSIETKRKISAANNGMAPELEPAAIEMYIKGKDLNRVGKEFGVSGQTIRNILIRAGVPTRTRAESKKKFLRHQEEEIAREYLLGNSCCKLSRKYGVCHSSIINTLKRVGTPSRKPLGDRARAWARNFEVWLVMRRQSRMKTLFRINLKSSRVSLGSLRKK